MTAAMAAVMLGIGVAVGAAIGPAPGTSFAIGHLVPLLAGAGGSPTTAQPPALTPQPTPPPATSSTATTPSPTTPTSAATTPAPSTPASEETTAPTTSGGKTSTLAPVTHVWLIQLSGTSFDETLAQASAAPYIDGQAIPSGTLLSSWSGLNASAFAAEAAQLAEPAPQLLNTIVQPPCPEGAAGAACAPGTPGALSAADEFLKATLPTITGTGPYRENGLIVVTFATIASATATGLPAGASIATVTAQPPAGALLISPFASAGAKSSTAFNPISPKQSLEKLLKR